MIWKPESSYCAEGLSEGAAGHGPCLLVGVGLSHGHRGWRNSVLWHLEAALGADSEDAFSAWGH